MVVVVSLMKTGPSKSSLEAQLLEKSLVRGRGIDNILGFDWPASPSTEAMVRSLEVLYSLGVLDDDAKLTSPVGFQVAELPLDPMVSKMIIASYKLECLEEIITIATILSLQSIWISVKGKRELDEAKLRFAASEKKVMEVREQLRRVAQRLGGLRRILGVCEWEGTNPMPPEFWHLPSLLPIYPGNHLNNSILLKHLSSDMRHSSARNVTERCFGILKARWGVLRDNLYYPVVIKNRIIMACCLLHNYIRQEMAIDPFEENASPDEGTGDNGCGNDDNVTTIGTSDE
uniref:RNA helicase n=1 Tax=Lactuca sativa TaxID=4236 RepID=A0A9R1UF27_LACSA|nr:hypothetical protein LSAT_V11C900459930 [Lactuca sativa]